MSRPNKGFFSLCIPLLALVIIFNSCENPGSVGGEFVERPTLTFDTLTVSNTEELSFNGYSGQLGFIPFGKYSDQIFGEQTVSAFFRPSASPNIPDSIEIDESFQLKLFLGLDSLEVYGDTLSESQFSVYEVTSNWRERSLKIDSDIQYGNQIGSFSVGQEKEIVVDLDQQWVDDYKSYYFSTSSNQDSSYAAEFKGLAIISDQGNTKVSFARSDETRFLMINGIDSDTTDTVRSSPLDYGFTLDRSGAVIPENTFPLHTTLEGLNKLTLPDSVLKADNSTKNIIRADLVFYEAKDELDATLPVNHQRLDVTSVKLHPIANTEPAYEYQFASTNLTGTRNESSPYFKANVTNYINNIIFGSETRQELVLGIGSTSGAIRSTLIYGATAPEDVRPKLIITSLVD